MGLSHVVEVDHAQLWAALRAVQREALAHGDSEAALDAVLDAVVAQLDADRGLLVLAHDDGGTSIVNARAQGRSLSVQEREEVSRSLINEALRDGELRLFDPVGDGSESVRDLGILCAIVVPLPGARRGALYVDFRERGKFAGERHAEFVQGAAEVLSMALDRGAPRRVEPAPPEDRAEPPAPALDTLLHLPGLKHLERDVRAALLGGLPVLLCGESGVGKTLLARAFANEIGRQPVVRATLGSSDDLNTITSELFGHERGAFSGASSARRGLVELAHGGTLILDEVLNLPSHAQQLLLDFVQFGTFRPLGHRDAAPRRAAVRLVTATNGDLAAAVAQGRFRADLYYRLAGVELRLPPLRERREDIPALAERLLARVGPERPLALSLDARRALVDPGRRWPGNARELEHAVLVARARALADDPAATRIERAHLPPNRETAAPPPALAPPGPDADLNARWAALTSERERLEEVERALIEAALTRFGGVVARAARELGAKRTSLISRMKKLGIREG